MPAVIPPNPNPAASAAAPTGQPPVGSSPATSPVPNKGLEAAAMAKLGMIVRQLEQIVPLLGAGTEAGRDVLKSLTSLSKHVPPGAVSPGVEQSAMQKTMMQMKQQTPQIAALRASMSGEKPGGESTPAPAAAA